MLRVLVSLTFFMTWNFVGFSSQSNYNSQGGGEGGNQGFGANHSHYHDPGGYGRGDAGMNYQYR